MQTHEQEKPKTQNMIRSAGRHSYRLKITTWIPQDEHKVTGIESELKNSQTYPMAFGAAFANMYRANHGERKAAAKNECKQYEASDVSDDELMDILFTDEPVREVCNQGHPGTFD
jgi:hypothetical protein